MGCGDIASFRLRYLMSAAVERALTELGDLAERDVPIGPLTTYRVGGAADIFVRLGSRADLVPLARAVAASGLPVLVLGRGSNLLVADSGFRGIAVSASAITDSIQIDESSATVQCWKLRLAAGVGSAHGGRWAHGVRMGSRVPGSVGGAVRMNAGGHGSDMAAALVSVTIADISNIQRDLTGGAEAGIVRSVTADALGLRFRRSGLVSTELVLDATLRLAHGDREMAEAELSEIVQWRRANQPGGQNAGSVFVNTGSGRSHLRCIDRKSWAARASSGARQLCLTSTPTSSRLTKTARLVMSAT